MYLFTDADVRALLSAQVAVAAARRALVDASAGKLAAPPRSRAELAGVSLTFTAGGYRDDIAGLRVYGSWPDPSDQVVLIWDAGGALRGVVVGEELGARRTGALGAVALAHLARPDSAVVAVIGTGRQAWAQLWAATAVLASLSEVRVFSRRDDGRAGFADRARRDLGVPAVAVPDARSAVAGADVVLCATSSATPVLQATWVGPGTHVSGVGPKSASAHELPGGLADTAAVVACDSPAQAAAYEPPFFTRRPLTHLGAVAAGKVPGRRGRDDITLYCSTGLAGSEVVLAQALIERAERDRGHR